MASQDGHQREYTERPICHVTILGHCYLVDFAPGKKYGGKKLVVLDVVWSVGMEAVVSGVQWSVNINVTWMPWAGCQEPPETDHCLNTIQLPPGVQMEVHSPW